MRGTIVGSKCVSVALACAFGFVVATSAGAREDGGASGTSAEAEREAVVEGKAAVPAGGDAVSASAGGAEVLGFRAFCDSWMQKLRERDAYNTGRIVWETRDGQVVGEHVAYGKDCTCTARAETGKDPIGKITYRETRYRRQGVTPAEALAAPGTILEHSDVTEIFRYAKGRWQY